MELNNLPTHELAQAAHAEALAFKLPEDWSKDREEIRGFAIDEPYSLDIDDAISLSNDSILRVSIADVGSFLPDQIAVSGYARQRVESLYHGQRVAAPMIPRPISEDKLSLLHGKERPVVTVHLPINPEGSTDELPAITRDTMLTQRISYAEISDHIDKENKTAIALRGLEEVACLLYAARHREKLSPAEAVIENEEGTMAGFEEYKAGKLIVQESMIAANAGMARFMQAHDIPALYRNHVIPSALLPEVTDPTERSALLGPAMPATYAPIPMGHHALNLDIYTHFTSPLRRFPDFANHANLIAFLEEREYPYPQDRLEKIALQLQQLTLKRNSFGAAPNRGRTAKNSSFAYHEASYLLNAFADGSAGPADIAIALFNTTGAPEEITAAKEAAARFAANHIYHARAAFNVAFAKRLVTLRPPRPEDGAPNVKLVLEDKAGNVYPFSPKTNPHKLAIDCAQLIGDICGVSTEPVIPRRYTREAKILSGAYQYLGRLAEQNRLSLSKQVHEESDDRVYAGIRITIGDEKHEAGATMPSGTKALREAAAQLITRLDLINSVPPVKVEPQKRSPVDPKENPISFVQARQTTARAPQAEYSFSAYGDNGSEFACTVRVVDIDGKTYTAAGEGHGKKAAKQQAAAKLLRLLPPRPLNKEGKMYQPPSDSSE